ncbi:DUF2680 domain-containing protein [Clostridium taeniosporum]|uniref:DUF2680 domain-containing protein n=1 Tax=Clostridium taeniosporum TaxID=394958 RepID=A0A1D7XNG9_9CLOT|nr:DUF2680 domain-containing protein [Clostridium taeniosporum]AOR24827.1 hypothetical protein BGI42_14320 [Clostridium taeniosporum]
MKKSILTLALVGILTVSGSVLAFADEMSTSKSNKTAGVQALIDNGLSFEDAKNEMLNIKFERVDKAVENGNITAERGEEIKEEMRTRSESCTTPGENKINKSGYGLNKASNNSGKFKFGNGNGKGNGMGMKNGSCLNNQ